MQNPGSASNPRAQWVSNLVQIVIGLVLGAVALAVVAASVWPGAAKCPIATVRGWCWLAALFPALIVVQHALYLYMVRAAQLLDRGRRLWPFESLVTREPIEPRRNATDPAQISPSCPTDDGDRAQSRAYRRAVESSVDREFDGIVLVLRYGLPALLMLMVTLAWLLILLQRPDPSRFAATNGAEGATLLNAPMCAAAWIGLAGAYCYTLLQLGRRAFVRDITGGVVTWCAITLVLGPLLAILLTELGLESVAAEGSVAAGNGTAVGGLLLAVHFVAGFSPRYVIETIFEGVRRKSGYMSSSNAVVRGVPLTDVRGIVPEVADRLSEEGISDVAGLALADPVRLLRNTAFDKRQVLGWIDEAILIVTLPEHWQAIEKLGITGAIDLAWCSCAEAKPEKPPEPMPNLAPPVPPISTDEPPCAPPIRRIAKALNFDPCTLGDIGKRLFEDAQVGMVWALYQARPSDG